MASSSSLPPALLSGNWEHHVFPSFHGPDVRKTFLSHVLKEFKSKGISPFIDNDMKRGEFIGPELKRAIRGSKILIVLLSERYASSSWCLDELVEIMKKEPGQTVLTVFYKVDPTDVKKQTGTFGAVFKETCIGKTEEKIGTWKKALEAVAQIAGYHLVGVDEAAMIGKIAVDISNELNCATPSQGYDCYIGMEAHMKILESFLLQDLNEVKTIGIWGPPGIGKSTIGRCLYNQFSNNFELRLHMVKIKENYPRPCLNEGSAQLELQRKMLSKILNHEVKEITNLGVARERLHDKRVFIVFDEVDSSAQVEALVGGKQWFGRGSRIIVISENRGLLAAHGVDHIYKVDFPTDSEAFQMFCMYAFGQKTPKDGFMELACEVTNLVDNLPLGLKVMGSHFKNMPREEWAGEIELLRDRLDGNIEGVLKFSYDALHDEDKYLFLHIACLFNYIIFEEVVEYLEKRFPKVRQQLRILHEKSLISIENRYVKMHQLLVKLGRDIVHKQSTEPGQRQFLNEREDITEALNNVTAGNRSVIGIDNVGSGIPRPMPRGKININERAFEGMSNLEFLRIKGRLSHGPSYLSPKLRLLHWTSLPMTCLPSTVNLELLVELHMPYSKLEKLWEGNKSIRNLIGMDLSFSKKLKELPNLSTATSLKELLLQGCSSLVKVPFSIGKAINLQILVLSQCSNLVKLPSSIGNATNLQKIDLKGCTSLRKLPYTIGNATNLQKLNLEGCSSLKKLPLSIGNATNLQKIDLTGCSSLMKLPSSIGKATNLQKLDLKGCSSLVEMPFSVGNAIMNCSSNRGVKNIRDM